jgi:predicted ATP-grasp superfamily ATP-dependent carboligase
MNRISVLIPDADGWGHVARCLAVSGQAVVHGFSLHPAPLLKHSRFFDSFEEYKGDFDIKFWLGRIGEVVAERRIDVVLPISEFAIRTLSEHRRTLSWAEKLPPLPNPHTFDVATNKASLADFLASHDLPHPPTVMVTTGIPVHDTLSALEFPVLAKPPLLAGGTGIKWFESLEALTAFLGEQSSDERWVVQSFVEGPDVGVNVLCRDGQVLAATVQHPIKASSKPFQTATGIEFRNDPAALNVAERLIRALGWSGIANIDMRYDALRKIPLVLELNGRYWFTLLGSLNAGINFPLLMCEMRLSQLRANRKPQRARYFSGGDSVFLSLAGGGRFRIKPHETNLRYFDPLPIAVRWARHAVLSVLRLLSRALPGKRSFPIL